MNPISRIAPVTDAEAAQMVRPDTLAELAERLTHTPAEAAAGAGDAVGPASWHSPRRTRRRLVVISASAVLTLLALGAGIIAAVNAGHGPSGANTGHANIRPLGPYGVLTMARPLPSAWKSTVRGAGRVAGFAVPTPHQAAAERANLTWVWVNNNHSVALVFAHGKVTIVMWPAVPAMQADPETWFRSVARKNANASFHWVNGVPAVAAAPTAGIQPPHLASVTLDRDGIYIEIDSTTYGTQTLLAIARSVH